MLTRRMFQAGLGRLLILAFGLALLGAGAPSAAGEGQAPQADYSIYLPLVRSHGALYGVVSHNGVPTAGITVKLYLFNGANWVLQGSTQSTAGGNYSFRDQPSLTAGQSYMVEYTNTTDSSRLSFWDTGQVTTYESGAVVPIGDFDVANVQLVAPSPGQAISLPYIFRWIRRPATPTDFYRVRIFDLADFDPYATTSSVGWVNEVQTPSTLPPGFSMGVIYHWSLLILGPAGGASFWANPMCFSSCPAMNAADMEAASWPMAQVLAAGAGDGPLGPAWRSGAETGWK